MNRLIFGLRLDFLTYFEDSSLKCSYNVLEYITAHYVFCLATEKTQTDK